MIQEDLLFRRAKSKAHILLLLFHPNLDSYLPSYLLSHIMVTFFPRKSILKVKDNSSFQAVLLPAGQTRIVRHRPFSWHSFSHASISNRTWGGGGTAFMAAGSRGGLPENLMSEISLNR